MIIRTESPAAAGPATRIVLVYICSRRSHASRVGRSPDRFSDRRPSLQILNI